MDRTKKIFTCLLLSLFIFVGMAAIPAYAAEITIDERELEYFKSIGSKDTYRYPSVRLYLGTSYIRESSYLINDTTYIPVRAVTELAGAAVKYDPILRRATVTMNGLVMTVTDGSYIVFANERALLSKTPAVILSDGRMYVPVRSIAKALSLGVEWRQDRSVLLSGAVKPITHANAYYRTDDLYWLSRIISAESRGEPLIGQIAVGNVVLNRMRHKDYPSTIYGVIFDKKFGIQFSPVKDGSIYASPTYSATVAAKICLEGVSVSPDILFFLEPSKSTSAWIPLNRKYAFTVRNHYFFY
ncbi:MAG: copper amine oxidase [Ruminococcaceae bacterium]|nr:copper amine oxidase [Oscillospiraceae bacterium]